MATVQDANYDCSALLSHIQQEETKLNSSNDRRNMMDFGHPPAPDLTMFRLSGSGGGSSMDQSTTTTTTTVLMVAFTRRCISAQVLTRGGPSRHSPFLVTYLLPDDDEEEETIRSLTLVALEDLSLVSSSAGETNSHVVFDENPKKRRVQFDEPTQIMAESTAKIRNLQLRGVIVDDDDQSSGAAAVPRLAVVFGTNQNRVLSVELRWNPNTQTIVLPPSSRVLEPLPLDPTHLVPKMREEQLLPFCPTGGVDQITSFITTTTAVTTNKSTISSNPAAIATPTAKKVMAPLSTTYIWISYGDGTILRIHHSAFFPSVVGDINNRNESDDDDNEDTIHFDEATTKPTTPSLQERLEKRNIKLLLRCQTKISRKDIASFSIIPLPKYHPSPLAPLSSPFQPNKNNSSKEDTTPGGRLLSEEEDKDDDEEGFNDDDINNDEEEGSTTALDHHQEVCEALLFVKSTGTAQDFPTFCFYTSEDQFGGRTNTPEAVSSGLSEAPIIGAVLGGLAGAFSFFGGGGPKTSEGTPGSPDNGDNKKRSVVPPGYFPNLRKKTIVQLYAGYEVHDAPRQVESCIIDPEGNLAATTDSFGRVMLIDLSTKQIIRMWKGFREASCQWLQVPQSSSSEQQQQPRKKSLFLVIHSRQRRVIEVYRVRFGPRVMSMQVGRDAQVIACKEFCPDTGDSFSSCYVVHSNMPGGAALQVLEKIVVQENDGSAAQEESHRANNTTQNTRTTNPKEAALRLQRLQQLLANTNVPCQLQDVHQALLQIKSLKDLATCLDRLAIASVLESKMGVTGTEFQKKALSYCRESLKDAVKSSKGDPASNPHVKLLATKIVYHNQVINAFDMLRRFEQAEHADDDQQVAPRSPWTEEAMGWVSTFDMVHGRRVDENQQGNSNKDSSKAPPELMKFSTFANACVSPKIDETVNPQESKQANVRIEVYLSDSSKTRRDILVHIFKPLLGDIFAFNVVNSIFGALGIMEDSDYLLKCFGEWYMTLTTKEASQKGFYSLYSPMMRWLQEMVTKQLDKKTTDEHEIALEALHTFCSESEDLVRAFMLGALCREAVAKAATKKEEKTYGKISSSEKVKKWDQLLRKLRVCLLVSLRLKGVRIGAFPITVKYVDKGDIFSVYEWVAHDELAMSHKHKEITTLEEACKVSGISFDPSTEAGDATNRFEMLQNACLSAALSEEERSEYLVDFDDDDKLGALLLFLKSHNEPTLLVAHRALILSSIWSQRPHELAVLANTLVALQALSTREDMESLAAAVRLEVWQTRIRPIFRALVVGFHDVQEISEHIVAPLLQNPGWFREFSRLALEILTLLLQIPWKDTMNTFEPQLEGASNDETWPKVRKDFILDRLVQRSRQIDRGAIDTHRVVLCGLRVSDDGSALARCVPNFHECFDTSSLFVPVAHPSTAELEQRQMFLEDAIIAHAQRISGKDPLETFGLGEIEILGAIWKFDMKNVRTTFALAMYDFGKDHQMDDLLTKSASLVNVLRLVEEGTDIVCRRLNELLHTKRGRSSPGIRDVLGLLDADMCSWVRERAEKSRSLVVFSNLQVAIASTHLFALRLLSLSRMQEVDKDIRVKIHSLIVLTGQLVKAADGSVATTS